jgi:DNA-binding transcriptional LysR family regulator
MARRLADLGSKHMLLMEGIGWGCITEQIFREDVEKGALIRLDMPELEGSERLYAIYRTAFRAARPVKRSAKAR